MLEKETLKYFIMFSVIGYLYSFMAIFQSNANPLLRLMPFIAISIYANYKTSRKVRKSQTEKDTLRESHV